MITRKRVEGEVVYNDGDFAEVETYGVEGIEEGIFLATLQLHVEDTGDTSEEFKQRFPIGLCLNIQTTVEVSPLSNPH